MGDITRLEPNIHAGVKYVRFMMDRYYVEPMTELDKASSPSRPTTPAPAGYRICGRARQSAGSIRTCGSTTSK